MDVDGRYETLDGGRGGGGPAKSIEGWIVLATAGQCTLTPPDP
jgi:hypothetical protein